MLKRTPSSRLRTLLLSSPLLCRSPSSYSSSSSTSLVSSFHTSSLRSMGSRINSTVTPSNPTKYFILEYTYDAQNMEELTRKRTPLRVGHLGHAAKAAEKGHMVLGGACTDTGVQYGRCSSSSTTSSSTGSPHATTTTPQPMKGILIFSSTKWNRDDVVEYAKSDPYYTGGLVSEFTIREWTVVLDALTKPGSL